MKYFVGALGLLAMPFILPLVAFAALVFMISAMFSNNIGELKDD